jgi:hypothetical protein
MPRVELVSGAVIDLVGKRVFAKVMRLEPYGVYFAFESVKIIALAPDIFEGYCGEMNESFLIGDLVELEVVGHIPSMGEYRAELVRKRPARSKTVSA